MYGPMYGSVFAEFLVPNNICGPSYVLEGPIDCGTDRFQGIIMVICTSVSFSDLLEVDFGLALQ